MGYPVWKTLAGNLGKVNAQEFFDLALEAVDPDSLGNITFELVAGYLPRGLQIAPNGSVAGNPEKIYVLEGVPFNANQDIVNEFTIRATNDSDGTITDRTFSITVTGNYPPQILTLDNPLGTYLDGTYISKQLEAFDLNYDKLTWSLSSGSLPPGLELSTDGLISGVIQPKIYSYSTGITGWDNANWDINPWQFTTLSSNAKYNFTVAVTDGKTQVTQKYTVSVYAKNDLRADSTSIYADTINISTDTDQNRPAVLLTTDMGEYGTINSGGYFAFKFNAVDYDVANIKYLINIGGGNTFDSEITIPENSLNPADIVSGTFGEGFDENVFDRSEYQLPPGLSIDENTGWLTGYIPIQYDTIKTYQFGVSVYGNNDIQNISVPRLFTINVLGNLDFAVNWKTPEDLGSIKLGSISNLAVEAFAVNGRPLTYKLVPTYTINGKLYGSKLPQGLKLQPDGVLSGRVSFQSMGFDRGSTTFDKQLASKFVYNNYTNFDNFYSFAVLATDYYDPPQLSAQKIFKVRLDINTYEPYEDLYARCFPSPENRRLLQQIINNTDIFDPMDIYRPFDPYYGIQTVVKFLVSYGIKASLASDYIAAMKARHYDKKFYFGDFKLAQGKDVDGNILYDVIYVDLIENTKIYESVNGVVKNKIPATFTNINATKSKWRNPKAKSLAKNQIKAATTSIKAKQLDINTNDTFYLNEALNVIAPNDLTLMQVDISNNLDNSYLNSLPEWMVSVQSNGKILGYTSAAPLVYLKPGTGAKALFNIKRFMPDDIRTVPFIVDRYILNNSYTNNFDISTRRFIANKYSTFDNNPVGYYLSDNKAVNSVFNVDFAVNRPFDSINLQDINYLIDTGGIDGITYNLNNKYIIFAKQDNFDPDVWGDLTNDGWNLLDTVIPGYTEKENINTVVNQRGGVWRINVDAASVITLTFIQEVTPGQVVYVNGGITNFKSYQLYNSSLLDLGYDVPFYTSLENVIFQGAPSPNGLPTTFDSSATNFINNVDTYTMPLTGDKYLKFPKIGVFTNDQ